MKKNTKFKIQLTCGVALSLLTANTTYNVLTKENTVQAATTEQINNELPANQNNSVQSENQEDKTEQYIDSTTELDGLVDEAKNTGVVINKSNQNTISTSSDEFSNSLEEANKSNQEQIDKLKDAIKQQQIYNQEFEKAKKQVPEIDENSANVKAWDTTAATGKQRIENLLSNTDISLDEVDFIKNKKPSKVTFADGSDMTEAATYHPGIDLSKNSNPSWIYHNQFVDHLGREVDVKFTITDYTYPEHSSLDSSKQYGIVIYTSKMNFKPLNLTSVTTKIEYLDSKTGTPLTINPLWGISDIDGYQGVKLEDINENQTMYGSNVTFNSEQKRYDSIDHTTEKVQPTSVSGQLWFAQKGVTSTTYTFYSDEHNDSGSWKFNQYPDQFLATNEFPVILPETPVLKHVTLDNVTFTDFETKTTHTTTYSGADELTPKEQVTDISWKSNIKDNKLVWQTDDSYNIETPKLEGYTSEKQSDQGPKQDKQALMPTNDATIINYQKNNSSTKVTFKFVDNTGKEIKVSDSLDIEAGSNFSFNAPKIDGYTFKNSDKPLSGTVTEDQIITLVYNKDNNETPDPDTEDNGKTPTPDTEDNGKTPTPDTEDNGKTPTPDAEDNGKTPTPDTEDNGKKPTPDTEDNGKTPTPDTEDNDKTPTPDTEDNDKTPTPDTETDSNIKIPTENESNKQPNLNVDSNNQFTNNQNHTIATNTDAASNTNLQSNSESLTKNSNDSLPQTSEKNPSSLVLQGLLSLFGALILGLFSTKKKRIK